MNRKKDYIWNTLAGMINAAEAVIMSMVVTRYGMLSDAGILSLAFAVGNVLMTIGKFGARTFQVTDSKKQYSFRTYLYHRFGAVVFMLLSLVGLLVYKGYSPDKSMAIIIISMIYAVEAVEDCFGGRLQAMDYLYVGSQMFVSRWLMILLVFIIAVVFKNRLGQALVYGAIAGGIVFFVWLLYLRKHYPLWDEDSDQTEKKFIKGLFHLFGQTFPLFIASFCGIFLSNIPKFAIDNHMDDEVQACYGFVAMPVFVIGLLNQFIYQPTVLKLTEEYNSRSFAPFRQRVRKQLAVVFGIGVMCLLGAGLIGIPVLSIIFNTDLSAYWKELVVLQFAGAFLAVAGYFQVLLTLMRKQGTILAGYLMTTLVGSIILNILVGMAGTMGASLGYLILMILLAVFYFVSYKVVLSRVVNNTPKG